MPNPLLSNLKVRRSLPVVLAVLTANCTTPSGLVARFVPPATDQFARAFIDTLQHASPQAVRPFLVPSLAANDAVIDTIGTLERLLPPGRPDSLQIISINVLDRSDGSTQRTVGYQLHASGKWAAVVLVMDQEKDAEPRVAGLHVYQLTASVQALNAFTWRRASVGGIIAAILAVVMVGLSLYAAVQVVRSPLKKRWLWACVALLGFGKLGVSWTTGRVSQQWTVVQLFGAGAVRDGLYGPWWIYVSFPGGAVIALDRRRRALAGQAQARAALEAVAVPVCGQTEPAAGGSGD